jgi:hypothetical protein
VTSWSALTVRKARRLCLHAYDERTGIRPHRLATVRDHLARFRGNAIIRAPAPKPPKPRAVTAWIMTRPGDLDLADQASLDSILASSPELAALTPSTFARSPAW